MSQMSCHDKINNSFYIVSFRLFLILIWVLGTTGVQSAQSIFTTNGTILTCPPRLNWPHPL